MADSNVPEFHWADYLVFVLTLVLSGAIGVYYAISDRLRRSSAADVLLGGRKMSILPVALSMLASVLSAISLLGVPSDTFTHGTMYLLITLSNFLAFPVTAHAFLPVFRRARGMTSAYEYLERRFSRPVRVLGSLLFMLQMLLYMAVVLYAPALALSQVMNLSMLVSIFVAGLVCTMYTAIGGLKAVIWTDTFQMAIILGGLLAVVIKATMEVGGVQAVLDVADEHGKINFNNFDPSPFTRYTFWSLVIGGFFTTMTLFGSNQAMIQRYLAMPSTRKAQISVYLNLPAAIILIALLVYLGLVAFARYHDNSPLDSCRIQTSDQLLPLLVMDTLGDYHGLPGLFVACIFSASLSTVSSGVNALAAVFLTDIAKPLYKAVTKYSLNETRAIAVSKVLSVVFGLATIGLAFLAGKLGSLIIQVALSIFGIFGGPLLGVFVLALFVPFANSWGAITGLICSMAVSFWLAVGSTIQRNSDAPPPRLCSANQSAAINSSMTTFASSTIATSSAFTTLNTTEMLTDSSKEGLARFYELSFMWYSLLAVLIVVIVGIVTSLITGGTRSKPVDARLLSPWYTSLSTLFSGAHATTPDELGSEDADTEDRQKNGTAVLAELHVVLSPGAESNPPETAVTTTDNGIYPGRT